MFRACLVYQAQSGHNKVFSLFSFLVLILDQNWVLFGDETHMANLLWGQSTILWLSGEILCSKIYCILNFQMDRGTTCKEKAQSMTGLSCLMNHPKASFRSFSKRNFLQIKSNLQLWIWISKKISKRWDDNFLVKFTVHLVQDEGI